MSQSLPIWCVTRYFQCLMFENTKRRSYNWNDGLQTVSHHSREMESCTGMLGRRSLLSRPIRLQTVSQGRCESPLIWGCWGEHRARFKAVSHKIVCHPLYTWKHFLKKEVVKRHLRWNLHKNKKYTGNMGMKQTN